MRFYGALAAIPFMYREDQPRDVPRRKFRSYVVGHQYGVNNLVDHDQRLMVKLNGGPQSAAIMCEGLAVGRSLSIPVLAEGVEQGGQLAFLRGQGCDEAQGYLLGRPVPYLSGSRFAPGAARAAAG